MHCPGKKGKESCEQITAGNRTRGGKPCRSLTQIIFWNRSLPFKPWSYHCKCSNPWNDLMFQPKPNRSGTNLFKQQASNQRSYKLGSPQ